MALFETALIQGLFASRPTDNSLGTKGRLYFATDTLALYYDNGVTWDPWVLSGGSLVGSATFISDDAITVPDGAPTALTYASVDGSAAAGFSFTSDQIEVLYDGYVTLSAYVLFSIDESTLFNITVEVTLNGSSLFSSAQSWSPPTPTTSVTYSSMLSPVSIPVVNGDILRVRVIQNTGNAAQIESVAAAYSYVTIQNR